MRLIIAAVGTRMPAWAAAGFEEFARRMPRELPLLLIEVKAEPRSKGKPPAALREAEALRLEAALPQRRRLLAVDERGTELTTRSLAQRLEGWMAGGEDVVFALGGPDGLAPRLIHGAAESLRLSGLTLPHALARVLLAEALYRAASLLHHHPYHRQ